jgi:hypothetical protein
LPCLDCPMIQEPQHALRQLNSAHARAAQTLRQ